MARIRIQPAISEMPMELTMPRGAEMSALWVSSDMWAEASYPVKVYCAIRSPIMKTNQGTPSVDSFSNFVKTKDAEAWWLGTKKRTTAIVSTPRMCHQALTSDRKATTRTPKVLMMPWTMRTQAYTVRTQPVVSGKFVVRLRNTVKKVANPKSM